MADIQAPGDDPRFSSPLYTLKRAAFYLDVAEPTLRRWAGRSSPWRLVTAKDQAPRHEPVMPFVGLAEAYVVRAFRQRTGRRLLVDEVLKLLQFINEQGGVEHALAHERIYFHGRELLFDFAKVGAREKELAQAFTKNQVFEQVVEGDLQLVSYRGGWAGAIVLPFTPRPIAIADPLRAFGEPMFLNGDARVVDVLDRFDAGDDPGELADDFDIPLADVLDIVRAASRKGRQAA